MNSASISCILTSTSSLGNGDMPLLSFLQGVWEGLFEKSDLKIRRIGDAVTARDLFFINGEDALSR